MERIVIRLPKIKIWHLALSVILFLFAAAFSGWLTFVKPYFWVPVKLTFLSTTIQVDKAGNIVETGPDVGDFVNKNQALFSLDSDGLKAKIGKTQQRILSLNEEIESQKNRMAKAVEGYTAASTEDAIKKQLTCIEEAQKMSENAESQLHNAEIELAELYQQMEKMVCLSPFEGLVLKKTVQIDSSQPQYVICDPKKYWLETNIPEKELGSIAIGQSVLIELAAYPKQKWSGKVSWVGLVSETHEIPIKISFDNCSCLLKPGLSGKVRIKRL